jgi:hypothetical protein
MGILHGSGECVLGRTPGVSLPAHRFQAFAEKAPPVVWNRNIPPKYGP